MIKEFHIRRLNENKDGIDDDVIYWRSRTPQERMEALEFMRRQMYDGSTEGVQRVYRVVKFAQS